MKKYLLTVLVAFSLCGTVAAKTIQQLENDRNAARNHYNKELAEMKSLFKKYKITKRSPHNTKKVKDARKAFNVAKQILSRERERISRSGSS